MPRQKPIENAEAINDKLRAAGVRLKVVVRNNKLSLRGTLPPRPNSTDTKPKQTYLALGLDTTTYGYKTALLEALKVWAALDQNKFSWDDYADTTEQDTCSSWIDRYKKHWIKSKGDTPENHRKWHRGEWLLGLRWLPPDQDLTAELLEEIAQIKPPNMRSRQRLVQILTHLAKFANIEVDLKPYEGNYSPTKVQPRDIPSDEEIATVRTAIKNPQWQLVYTRMAVYGLRDHEAWLCEIDSTPPHACRVLNGKTGSRDGVMPLYPEWASRWQPWEGQLPKVECHGDFSVYGDRTSKAFSRAKIPFSPYNLRHAYAIRASVVFEFPPAVAARMMGHSATVHLNTYNRWIASQHTLDTYKEIMATTQHIAP